jgi:IclR family pca regulon transcriptional regulator
MGSEKNESGLQNTSIVRGFGVLEAFDRGRTNLTLTQLVQLTGLEKSAVQRFTATLVELGYLRKDPVRRDYTLAPKLLHLGTSYLRTNPLIERATPYLTEWSREHNETINLGELDGTDLILSYRLAARRIVSPDISIGSRFPWHVTSSGQAIAAFMEKNQRMDLIARSKLESRAVNTIIDKKALATRLDQIKQQGFAVCVQESSEEDISIAAPIFDSHGSVVAAVATGVLIPFWTPDDAVNKLVPQMRLLAKAITGLTRNGQR